MEAHSILGRKGFTSGGGGMFLICDLCQGLGLEDLEDGLDRLAAPGRGGEDREAPSSHVLF